MVAQKTEEVDSKLLEAWGAGPMKNCTHVCFSTLERETVKVGKRGGRHHRRMRELPFYVTVGNRVEKDENKSLNLGHR